MELPEEVVEFADWFKTDGSDTQKIDKLAFIYGLERKPDETNDQLVMRTSQQRNNLYSSRSIK